MKLRNKIVALFLTVACAFGLAVAGNAQRVDAAEATYTMVTDVANLSDGDAILIVAHGYNYAMGTVSNSIGSRTAITRDTSNNTITADDSKVTEYYLESDGSTANAFYIKDITGKYLSAPSENKVTLGTTKDLFKFTVGTGTGEIKVNSSKQTNRYLQYNANSGQERFCCYKNTQKNLNIYVRTTAAPEKTDAEKVADAISSLSVSAIVWDSIALPTAGMFESTISWESNNEAIVIDNNVATVVRGQEDTVVTLTATVSLGEVSDSTTFDVTVKAGRNAVTNPIVGTYYKLMLSQENKSADYYLTGAMSGYYYAASKNAADGALVSLEEVEGGYYLVCTVDGTSSYMNIVDNGEHKNVKFESTASSVWTFNTEYNTFTTVLSGATYYLGTYKTYETFSASTIDKAETSFVSHLVELTEAELEELNALKVKVGYQVGTKDEAKALRLVAELNLTAEDLETFESTIAFRVTHNDVADERVVTTLYSSVNPMNDEAELTGAYYAVLTYVNVPAGEYTVEVLVDGEVAATVVATVA